MKNKRMTLRQKRAITGFLFILPWFIGFLVYYLKSLIHTVQFSLSNVRIAETGGYTTEFIGAENFRFALLEHATFNQVLADSLWNILIDVPFIIFFSLFIAIMLNSRFKGRALVRAIFFLPILLGSGAVRETLQLATENIQGGAASTVAELATSSGVNVDYFLHIFVEIGLPEQLVEYITGLIARIYEIVRASSVQIIVFLAALQSVPSSMYEVAQIEGATTYETFWKVTFPMVSPLIITNVIYTIVDSFATSEVVTTAYDVAFIQYNYGLSSAMSLLSTIVVCTVLAIVAALISKKTFYYN
ncbi:MAG TPA: sugar ABC transporter permease [Lachnospiraceae bacterium]|jgi:ABC-type sugar transport system permease subunit|nr:sugar ABC transporter permease [Lachnospiraceae bacterium]HBY72229.1 sugar ABC transporter permease [Lachnospiraceae bacterium]HCM12173.1 sugar ABC transporter permease [Lachnospiraceae bacterium]HCR39303.1 sugar ABC transporter permease [Lachnospiraceae bacterium]